ncbi:bifunctional arginine demethylase and lysyl-hydroxylase JMJD6-B [Cylas formicarius]|uniref:bifunctional arginine demethylase and lysyl-hydroxylase JMJD6-B n=1 Tax=Cylas formicarius TaxID=197179 RepID=UPI0029586732|nr:bifunctional arginine demethylase and lysyl-hydroxylase JMJD6-B [Cylas formicarius]
MGKPEEKMKAILRRLENSDVPDVFYKNFEVVEKLKFPGLQLVSRFFWVLLACVIACSVLSKLFISGGRSCIIDMPEDGSKIFREPEFCEICENVTQVDKISNVSAEDFNKNYVKTAKPVVVTDGALKWPALKTFNFEFFKKLFKSVDINRGERKNCQFFPYKTEFKSLREVFDMTPERAQLKPGEKSWYVGWSNCNDNAGNILKGHYEKPYFLSNISENIALSWIFMGGPGRGAHMHVDNVHYPSWQAQLSGKKMWKLAPPPECYYRCKELEVLVEPGEIIVLDTNRWYHETSVLLGDVSITIGAEFD